MAEKYDIILGGGGLTGSIMALALANYGFSIALIDESTIKKKRMEPSDGRAYAINMAAAKMLSAVKIWSHLEKNAQPILDIKVSDGRAGEGASPFYMHFDHRELSQGPLGFMMEDRFIRDVLLEAVTNHTNIKLFWGTSVMEQKVFPNFIEVKISSNKRLQANLLVGSDGRRSQIAANAQIKKNIFDYKQMGLVSVIAHQKDHLGQAHQFFMPSGPIAILPLSGRRSSLVWTLENTIAKRIVELNDTEYLNELKYRVGDFRGKIALEGKRFSFPLNLVFAENLVADRVALVGDSAHALHPLAGQGLNLGVRDIATLVEVLVQASRRGEDIGKQDVLSRYDSWRCLDRVTVTGFTHVVNKVFSNDNAFLKSLRGLSMATVNNSTVLREKLFREANGLLGDLPALMKGQAL